MAVVLRPTLHQALTITPVARFMPRAELLALDYALRGPDCATIGPLIAALANTLADMPHTYPHQPQGDAAIVHLHYFHGESHWYVTEMDSDGHAFGFLAINGALQNAAPYHVDIDELVLRGVELDLYWTKRTLGDLKLQLRAT